MITRGIVALILGVAAGVLASVALAAVRGEPIYPEAVWNGLAAAVPATIAVLLLGRRRQRRSGS